MQEDKKQAEKKKSGECQLMIQAGFFSDAFLKSLDIFGIIKYSVKV